VALPCTAALALVGLHLGVAATGLVFVARCPEAPPLASRRSTLLSTAAAAATGGGLAPDPARAEAASRGWQLKLPPDWRPYRQAGVPGPDDPRPRELLVAGNSEQKAEVKVVRVPLVKSARDPDGIGSLALVDYFSPPAGQQSRVTQQQVIEILSQGQSQQPAIFSFSLVGSPNDKRVGEQRYLRYDFEASRCEGAQVIGVNSKICERSDTGEVLPTLLKHHAIVSTVSSEPLPNMDGAMVEILWIMDISAPVEIWPQLTEQVNTVVDSFGVGAEASLATSRGEPAPEKAA